MSGGRAPAFSSENQGQRYLPLVHNADANRYRVAQPPSAVAAVNSGFFNFLEDPEKLMQIIAAPSRLGSHVLSWRLAVTDVITAGRARV